MLDSILAASGKTSVKEIVICTAVSLIMGLIIALVSMFKNTYSKNFVFTIAFLPVLVQSVIMVVNGNLGAGVAVAGAFSLVRFRSAPGNAREIISIFFAMAVGLSAGMGYIYYAIFFTIVVSLVMLLYSVIRFGESNGKVRTLKIIVPEDFDYSSSFDDIFKDHLTSVCLERVRTTNLGGLYELKYLVSYKNNDEEKVLLDKIRQRNGNLAVVSSIRVTPKDEL